MKDVLTILALVTMLPAVTFANVYYCEANKTNGYDLKVVISFGADGKPANSFTVVSDVTKIYCSELVANQLKSCQ